jgi:hypothetical protein
MVLGGLTLNYCLTNDDITIRPYNQLYAYHILRDKLSNHGGGGGLKEIL